MPRREPFHINEKNRLDFYFDVVKGSMNWLDDVDSTSCPSFNYLFIRYSKIFIIILGSLNETVSDNSRQDLLNTL